MPHHHDPYSPPARGSSCPVHLFVSELAHEEDFGRLICIVISETLPGFVDITCLYHLEGKSYLDFRQCFLLTF